MYLAGNGNKGEIIAVVNFSSSTDRDAVEVTWDTGFTNVYRLGYKGKLDVKCVGTSTAGHYYVDHIPALSTKQSVSYLFTL